MVDMLDERQKKILLAIVQSHIDMNAPVGSSLISKRYPFGLSSATIRNIMASLEKMDYIQQPHTSAGRIPTEKGYRFYVNSLMDKHTFSFSEKLYLELSNKLQSEEKSSNKLIRNAAKTLSNLSNYMAVALPPKAGDLILKHIKFIRYDRKKVLSVLISEEGAVKNIFIELDKIHTQNQLDKAALYINEKFRGLTIREIKEKVVHEMLKEKAEYNNLIINMLYLFDDAISIEEDEVYLNGFSGTSYLPDFFTMIQIKQILKAIEDKSFVLKLLNEIGRSEGVQVLIGMEKIVPEMKECSMVISTYCDKTLASGAIGIIGPTRMNYKKLIPIVDHTARVLTKILSIQ